jgi:hypothetical protein
MHGDTVWDAEAWAGSRVGLLVCWSVLAAVQMLKRGLWQVDSSVHAAVNNLPGLDADLGQDG